MTFKFVVRERDKTLLKGLTVGYAYFKNVRVEKKNKIVEENLKSAMDSVASNFKNSEDIIKNPVILGMRKLFKTIGLDPTKERPSGEALIRRIATGKGIYRINSIVDFNNSISLKTGFPCGVYDADKIKGETIEFIIGEASQTYEGIGGRTLNAEHHLLTRDNYSIFGGPTADSSRTAITSATSNVLMLIYCPSNQFEDLLISTLDNAIKQMEKMTGCSTLQKGIFVVG